MTEFDAADGTADPGSDRPRQALFERAYERIEALLVNCSLAPGRHLTMNDLMQVTGLGRTPVHHAVSRLASDTLILIRPRHGLQIAPINLARERQLLQLRRDLERFVVRLAAERLQPEQRAGLQQLDAMLSAQRATLSLDAFNRLDRAIDAQVLAAAGEPFLENTLRPLHTIFRRIGHIHHSHRGGPIDLSSTVDRHLEILGAIAAGDASRAVEASDALIAFVDRMFEDLEASVDPAQLDSSAAPMLA